MPAARRRQHDSVPGLRKEHHDLAMVSAQGTFRYERLNGFTSQIVEVLLLLHGSWYRDQLGSVWSRALEGRQHINSASARIQHAWQSVKIRRKACDWVWTSCRRAFQAPIPTNEVGHWSHS